MKRLLPLVCFIVLSQCCLAAPKWILFKGYADAKYNHTKIYIKRIPGGASWKDSAMVKEGKFEFRKEFIEPCAYEFYSEYQQDVLPAFTILTEQPGLISVSIVKNGIAKVKGSFAQTVYEQFLLEQKILLAAKATAARIAADTVKRDPNQALVVETVADQKDDVTAPLAVSTALKYPNTFASAYILENYGSDARIADIEKAYRHFSNPVRESYAGERLKLWLNKLKSADRGQTVADFSLNNASGQTVHFSDIKEKVVLINFWASWCGPCREEFALLRQLYEKHKDKGFTIISISEDESAAAWKKALNQEQLPWPQWHEERKDATIAELRFEVTRYPTIFLLDASRKILYRDLRGGVLDKVIEGLLNE